MHYTALVQLPPMDIMLPVRLIAMPLQRPQHFPNMVKYKDLNHLEEIIAIKFQPEYISKYALFIYRFSHWTPRTRSWTNFQR